VFAAIGGGVTPDQGKPGDRIVLATGDSSNPRAYAGLAGQTGTVYLIRTADLDAQIKRYGHQVCGTAGDRALGSLTWKAGIGTLAFRIPNVPQGQYYFQIMVRNVSPDCWRIGASDAPLVLTVNGTVAPSPTAAPSSPNEPPPLSPLIALVALAVVAVATVGVARITRQPA
jgi:hypothetical protein